MKTELQEMNEAEFDRYLEWFIPDYAGDLSENFLIPMDKALEESKNLMRDLLPDKQKTVDQHVCHIYSVEEEQYVGVIWYNIQPETHKAYIYHILIHEAFRNRGFASTVLSELEETVRKSGITSLGLNVFGNNPGAQRVYEKAGYQASSVAMGKRI